MRLLVASDLHGSVESLLFLLEKARELTPDALVLLGDLVYHGPRNPLPQGYDTRSVLQTMPDLSALPGPVMATAMQRLICAFCPLQSQSPPGLKQTA